MGQYNHALAELGHCCLQGSQQVPSANLQDKMLAALSWMAFGLSSNSLEIKRNIEIGRAANEQMWRMVNTSKITCVGLIQSAKVELPRTLQV